MMSKRKSSMAGKREVSIEELINEYEQKGINTRSRANKIKAAKKACRNMVKREKLRSKDEVKGFDKYGSPAIRRYFAKQVKKVIKEYNQKKIGTRSHEEREIILGIGEHVDVSIKDKSQSNVYAQQKNKENNPDLDWANENVTALPSSLCDSEERKQPDILKKAADCASKVKKEQIYDRKVHRKLLHKEKVAQEKIEKEVKQDGQETIEKEVKQDGQETIEKEVKQGGQETIENEGKQDGQETIEKEVKRNRRKGNVSLKKRLKILLANKLGRKRVEKREVKCKTLKIGDLMFPRYTAVDSVSARKTVLHKVLETLPFSGGRSEILLRKHVERAIMKGLVHPSEIRYDPKWWKMRLKEIKAEKKSHPLGKKHPLTMKFAAIAKRYAKQRRQALKGEHGGYPHGIWPNQKIARSWPVEKMNADAIVENIQKRTNNFGSIKHLFEGNTGKMGSLFGWPVMNLMILLEQLQACFDFNYGNRMVINEINRFWAVKSQKVKRKNRRIKMMGKKGMEYRPEKLKDIWKALQRRLGNPSLQQSLDYAKVYLAKQFPEGHLRTLASEKHVPEAIDGPSQLLAKDIAELTKEAPVVPGYYYYATVFPYYKWLYDVRGSEARKEFYLKAANFCLRNQLTSSKEKIVLEKPKDHILASYIQ